MLPQGQVQVSLNHLEHGMNIQVAGEAPRFQYLNDKVALESKCSSKVQFDLIKKGHKVISLTDCFGGFQGILIDPKLNAPRGIKSKKRWLRYRLLITYL